MTQPTYTSIDARILRLKVLVIESREIAYPIMRPQTIEDIDFILDEVHRLHLAVSEQRAELAKIIGARSAKAEGKSR